MSKLMSKLNATTEIPANQAYQAVPDHFIANLQGRDLGVGQANSIRPQ